MNKEIVAIIIPTYNNALQLRDAIQSIKDVNSSGGLIHIYVVNNGHKDSCDWIDKNEKNVTVIQTGGKNAGWEGGLKLGIKASTAPYIMFLNDDIFVPQAQANWINILLQAFRDPKVAATGPASNTVMGFQNMLAHTNSFVFEVKFLIGFCMVVRRSYLKEVGGIDTTLPGGDDIDLSIRFRKAGYKLIANKNAFVFHYGFQTGIRLYGDHTKNMGWNSPQFTAKVNEALIRKHGFRAWWETLRGAYALDSLAYSGETDKEGKLIKQRVNGKNKKIIEVGCGSVKTFPNSIGLDIIPKGTIGHQLSGNKLSVADIACDVSKELPLKNNSVDLVVARHILEHMINPIEALRFWIKPLKKGGRIVIAVPNEKLSNTIPLNPEHLHAFTSENMVTLLEAVGGLKPIEMWDNSNGISFTTVAEKI